MKEAINYLPQCGLIVLFTCLLSWGLVENLREPIHVDEITAISIEPNVTFVITTEETTEELTTEESSEEFIGTFSRGTYYSTGTYGGSGRKLVSGYSIASRALYEKYGYGDYKIRIECDAFPELNGLYSLDDCSGPGNYGVVDFWFAPGKVPKKFRTMGVFEVRAYIVY